MASYDAEINLLISGMRQLDEVSRKIDGIQDKILAVNKLDISPQQRDPSTGRFTKDPGRQNRILLAELREVYDAELKIEDAIKNRNKEQEAGINKQAKLNAAANQYAKVLEDLDRGGAGQGLSATLQSQAVAIQQAYDAATDGGTKNLALIKSLTQELSSIVQIQNQINRLSSFQIKSSFAAQGFETQLSGLRGKAAGISTSGGLSLQGVPLQPAAKSVGIESVSAIEKQISEFRAAVSAGLESEAEKLKTSISGSLNLLKAEINEAAIKSANEQSEISAAIGKRQDAIRSWSNFFSDATQEAERLKTETLQKYARLRGAQASDIPMGPLPAGRPGGARHLIEERDMIKEMLTVEKELASIRDNSLKDSLKLEDERLKLVEQRKKKEAEIRDTIVDAITFGKGQEVASGIQSTIENVKRGGTNALIRGGLTAGGFGIAKGVSAASMTLAGASEALTSAQGPLSSLRNAVGDWAVNVIGDMGSAFNDALGGVPGMLTGLLDGLGQIPNEVAIGTIALMAFAPAAKSAAEAAYALGKAFGQSGMGGSIKQFGNDVKLVLDRQTNIFESAIDAMSSMELNIGELNTPKERPEDLFTAVIDSVTEMNMDLKVSTDYMDAFNDIVGDVNMGLTRTNRTLDEVQQHLHTLTMIDAENMVAANQQAGADFKAMNTRQKALQLRKEEILQIKRAEDFERRLAVIRERDTRKKEKTAFNENLALGVGFPLMFGAGPGSVAGSAIGSFFGSGFGGQILGGAIGQILDQSVASAAKLGNALAMVNGEYGKLREQGIAFSAELEAQTRMMLKAGESQQAKDIAGAAITTQTGDINQLGFKAGATAVNELQKAWDGVLKSAQSILGLLAAPFILALTAILRVVQAILFVINFVVTGIMSLIALIPGIAELGQLLTDLGLSNTAEYENQLNELNKQIEAQDELAKLEEKRALWAGQTLKMNNAQLAIFEKKVAALERQKAFEKEIRDLRLTPGPDTAEGRAKFQELLHLKNKEFAAKEIAIALKDAQSIYNTILDHNRDIAEKNKQNAQQYYDMVLQNARAQQDFDIAVARKVQDAQVKMTEQRFEFEKKKRQEAIKAEELANKQSSMQRSLAAAMSSTPEEGALLNTVQTALDEWRTGRKSVEQEAQDKQRSAQLEAQKAMIAIERYKLDNALRIARANEDSQLKIRRINEQINKQNDEVQRKGLERQIEGATYGLKQAMALQRAEQMKVMQELESFYQGKKSLTGKELDLLNKQFVDFNATIKYLDEAKRKIEDRLSGLSVSRLTPMGAAPALTDTSAPASKAEEAAVRANTAYQNIIIGLEKINGLTAQDIDLAKKFLDPAAGYLDELNKIIKAQQEKLQYEKLYVDYIKTGATPALAEQLAQTKLIGSQQEKNVSILIAALQAAALIQENPEMKKALEGLVDILQNVRDSISAKTTTALAGIQAENSFGSQIASEANRAREELNAMLDPINQVKSAAAGIGDAFSQSFMGVINGTMTAQDALASFFNNVANFFLDMAGKIIAKWIEMTILNSGLQLFPGAPSLPISPGYGGGFMPTPNANGNAFNANGIVPFANGGMFTNSIVSSPTLFRFADGAAMRTGVMGEAGSEAIMPLARGPGGALGVHAYGGGGGDTNITIHVDATGTKVAGDNTNAKELGRVITAAVQSEIAKQKRPGGLLSS